MGLSPLDIQAGCSEAKHLDGVPQRLGQIMRIREVKPQPLAMGSGNLWCAAGDKTGTTRPLWHPQPPRTLQTVAEMPF